jgi:hypothetical protein
MAEIFSVQIHTGDPENNEFAYEGHSFYEAYNKFYALLVDEKRPFFLGVHNGTRATVIHSSNNDYLIANRRNAAQRLREMGFI